MFRCHVNRVPDPFFGWFTRNHEIQPYHMRRNNLFHLRRASRKTSGNQVLCTRVMGFRTCCLNKQLFETYLTSGVHPLSIYSVCAFSIFDRLAILCLPVFFNRNLLWLQAKSIVFILIRQSVPDIMHKQLSCTKHVPKVIFASKVGNHVLLHDHSLHKYQLFIVFCIMMCVDFKLHFNDITTN